jgi:hypothetical protein
MSKHSKAHPGFKAVETRLEHNGYSKEEAGAILAEAARNSSKQAHKHNPKLNKVHGK